MITKQHLKQLAPNSKDEIIEPLVIYLNKYMQKYEVNTYFRICHFLAQAAHESASFRTLTEYASGAAYEGRKDLGNTKAGDGIRYKGRGIFQLTGRANYRAMGDKLKVDLENNPDLAATAEISVLTALEYWLSRKLNTPADSDNVELITKRINGGLNGFDDRKNYLAKAKKIIPKDIKFNVTAEKQPEQVVMPTIIVAKKGDISSYVEDLQNMLIKKGADIVADGNFGFNTETAVKTFQQKHGLPITGSIDAITLNKLME